MSLSLILLDIDLGDVNGAQIMASATTRNMVVYFAEFFFASAFTITILCNCLQIKVPFILYGSTDLIFLCSFDGILKTLVIFTSRADPLNAEV